jgi:hypothetical protein
MAALGKLRCGDGRLADNRNGPTSFEVARYIAGQRVNEGTTRDYRTCRPAWRICSASRPTNSPARMRCAESDPRRGHSSIS